MWPDRVLNSEPLTLELDALPTELRGPAYQYLLNENGSYLPGWATAVDGCGDLLVILMCFVDVP